MQLKIELYFQRKILINALIHRQQRNSIKRGLSSNIFFTLSIQNEPIINGSVQERVLPISSIPIANQILTITNHF